ncbi:hypothetical protein DICVIV_00195 [Dictyocaulus viviparus]|uniref:Uncharacterized protein n=1 Tax=Dictyocaulus viviparus TaxID=29172 RepID=A0A0D8YGF6_DICVI|nr:hypothetical protein DICVIV_00195 [Dictyocaulus viviparus]
MSFFASLMKFSIYTIIIITISIVIIAVKADNFTINENERQHLVFGHLTITATVVISVATVILTIFTAMACYIDFRNVRKEIGNLEVFDDFYNEQSSMERDTRVISRSERRSLRVDDSAASLSAAAVKPTDLAVEASQVPKVAALTPRRDAQAKQARIIEAIYQASGRDVPAMYRSEKKPGEKIVVPAAVQQTLEGIADRDAISDASPTASPTRFFRTVKKSLSMNIQSTLSPKDPRSNLSDEKKQTDVTASPVTTTIEHLTSTTETTTSVIPPVTLTQPSTNTTVTAIKPATTTSQPIQNDSPDNLSTVTPSVISTASTAPTKEPFNEGESFFLLR